MRITAYVRIDLFFFYFDPKRMTFSAAFRRNSLGGSGSEGDDAWTVMTSDAVVGPFVIAADCCSMTARDNASV